VLAPIHRLASSDRVFGPTRSSPSDETSLPRAGTDRAPDSLHREVSKRRPTGDRPGVVFVAFPPDCDSQAAPAGLLLLLRPHRASGCRIVNVEHRALGASHGCTCPEEGVFIAGARSRTRALDVRATPGASTSRREADHIPHDKVRSDRRRVFLLGLDFCMWLIRAAEGLGARPDSEAGDRDVPEGPRSGPFLRQLAVMRTGAQSRSSVNAAFRRSQSSISAIATNSSLPLFTPRLAGARVNVVGTT
jgi:hypothetical protein